MRTSTQIFVISIIVPSLMLPSSASILAQTPATPFVIAQLLGAPGGEGGQRKPEPKGDVTRPEAPRPQAPRPEAPRQEAPRQEAPRPAPIAPRPMAPPPAAAPRMEAPAPRPEPVQRAPAPVERSAPPVQRPQPVQPRQEAPVAPREPAQRQRDDAPPQRAPMPVPQRAPTPEPQRTPAPEQQRAPQPIAPRPPVPSDVRPPVPLAPAPVAPRENRGPADATTPNRPAPRDDAPRPATPSNAPAPIVRQPPPGIVPGRPLPPAGTVAPAPNAPPVAPAPGTPGAPVGRPPAGQGQPVPPAPTAPGIPPAPGAVPPPAANAPLPPRQPGQFGQPGQPGQPGQQGQPNQPGQPGQFGQPGQPRPPGQRGSGIGPGGAAALGAAAGLVGGFMLGQGVQRFDDVRQQRREFNRDGVTVFQEPGRTIIREDNRIFITHDENERFRDLGGNFRSEQRGNQQVSIYQRPNGDEIITVTDTNGQLLRRSRRLRDGREIVLIDNGFDGPQRSFEDEVIVLPPPPINFPRERYVVDAGTVDEGVIYDTLIAPPVAPIPRRYSLNEIRQSPSVRAYVRSVDLDTINFETGSWTVTPDQAQRLAAIAQALNKAIQANPSEVYLIEGHTDAVGSDVDNLSLSDRRAQSVAAILTKDFNVPPENLTAQGYGSQYPKVQTSGASRENRRVALRRITPLLTGQNAQ